MKTTRRFFLGGAAVASLPLVGAAQDVIEPPPTREELEHYYAFLWAEFRALADEMGVDMHDSYTAHRSGGIAAYKSAFGDTRPSTRARVTVKGART
ncbi:hypothetical protein C8J35_103500 [Rhizobium sp. PP-F2F-G38]|nr:hypothetical protein C8J35_103500 [Rhizobium sp. PP-F2F-G38]